MTIYDINSEIMKCIDCETGEILDEERLSSLQMQRDAKIENVCLWIKNINADVDAFKTEEDALAKRRKSKERLRDRLMRYVSDNIGEEFETTRVRARYNTGEQVKILDESIIPKEFWREKAPEINKAAIKRAIKAGDEVAGAKIEKTYNLQIV